MRYLLYKKYIYYSRIARKMKNERERAKREKERERAREKEG